jgi:hypothetical protein
VPVRGAGGGGADMTESECKAMADRAAAAISQAVGDLIHAAVLAEREECARLAERTSIVGAMGIVLCRGEVIADAIRGRPGPVAGVERLAGQPVVIKADGKVYGAKP